MIHRQSILRPAVVVGGIDSANQTCVIEFTDRIDGRRFVCTMPHPMAAPGWGVFASPTVGTRVLAYMLQGERPQIVATVPISQFAQDFSISDNVGDISVDEAEYPSLPPGTIALQSPSNSSILLNNDGSIKLASNDLFIEYSPSSIVSEKYRSHYINLESSRHISGPIKRDLREVPKASEKLFEKLIDISADKALSTIGRNPNAPVKTLTIGFNTAESTGVNEVVRNPSLVEHRNIIYEYGHSFMVGTYAEEVERLRGVDEQFLFQNERRDMSRTDVLNLGMHLPNNLIETVAGTVVDIYGNILDLNRNIIDYSSFIKNEELKNPDTRIQLETTLLRRSIKYHFELNARKSTLAEVNSDTIDGVSSTDSATQTGYSLSRLALDVDGEGLVKINIPASSNTGNIPLLSRYINSHNPDDRNAWEFRDSSRKDISHIAFGNTEGTGIDITATYKPENINTSGVPFRYRTAYHDIRNTANSLLFPQSAVIGFIDNAIGSPSANAGGRSLHANLDGSLELNIGRDVADKKSILLDTAGSIISRIGKDNNKYSIISQLDGHIAIQVGGDSVRGESTESFNTIKFYVKSDTGFHKIEINNTGIFVTSAPNTNLVMQSERNLVLSAKGEMLIDAESIKMYGKYSDNGNTITGERLVLRSGKEMR
jgi:hypothetical protein